MDLSDLPNDIFLLIIQYLPVQDVIRSRFVSKRWKAAFTNSQLMRDLLKRDYCNACEVRQVTEAGLLDEQLADHGQIDWVKLLDRVAARYQALLLAKPRVIERLPLYSPQQQHSGRRLHFYGVAGWERHLEYLHHVFEFHHPEPFWAYDDGLLAFPDMASGLYVLRDLASNSTIKIPFETEGKIMRRVRMKDRLLVFEWAEEYPFHRLNETEEVHRHFATAYDIFPDGKDASSIPILSGRGSSINWLIEYRNEWKTHFLGMPLNNKDRFFTAHTRTHHAIYTWQPNRSAWGEDEPLESLVVWDISSRSPSPSATQTRSRPDHEDSPSANPSGNTKTNTGPHMIKILNFRDLAFYNVRQGPTPSLSHLDIDDDQVYFREEDCAFLYGHQVGVHRGRLFSERVVAIPLVGDHGPAWEQNRNDENTALGVRIRPPEKWQAMCERFLVGARFP
ncbi:MAG: hypothetical protein M1819_002574 [Sarea resinae]|nr:MAG: hypothetical protein M1819_002574 [Sarea resinae]